MKATSDETQSWEPCQVGLLVGCSRRAKSAQTRKTLAQIGGGVLAVILVVGLGAWSANGWRHQDEHHFGGIACSEVQKSIPSMMAGDLPDDVLQRVKIHLEECPICQEIAAKMQAQQATRVGFEQEPAVRLKSDHADALAAFEGKRSLAVVMGSAGH